MTDNDQTYPAELPAIKAAVKDFYRSICFAEHAAPDIGLLRSLFLPEGMLIRMTPQGPSIMKLETFVSLFREQIEGGFLTEFHEEEIFGITETFGRIAHVFSTYEARKKSGDETQTQRGINSIQLLKDKGRWRVVSILWEHEGEDSPLLESYLP